MGRLAILALILLSLSGCVWTRLLSLKNQFADFDRHVAVRPGADGLTLELREPVIEPGDIAYLFGGGPSAHAGAQHSFRFARPAKTDGIPLELMLEERDGLVVAITLPPRMLRILPHERLVSLLRAFGHAEIDKGKREANASLDANDRAPVALTRERLIEILGPPDDEHPRDGGQELVYRYELQVSEGPAPKANLSLVVQDGRLAALRVQAARFSSWLKLPAP